MRLKKIILLALIGGLSGALESLVSFLSSLILPQHILFFDFIIGGLVFVIVGIGLLIPLIMMIPELVEKKFRILLFGAIGGFVAGLFFHFGIGLYLGIVLYPALLSLAFKALQMPKVALRILLGGVLGGIGGILISTCFLIVWVFVQKAYPALENQLSIFSTILSTSIITYFMSFSLLFSVRHGINVKPL